MMTLIISIQIVYQLIRIYQKKAIKITDKKETWMKLRKF